MRELLIRHGLQPENWRLLSETATEVIVVSRRSGRRKVLDKKGKTNGKRIK